MGDRRYGLRYAALLGLFSGLPRRGGVGLRRGLRARWRSMSASTALNGRAKSAAGSVAPAAVRLSSRDEPCGLAAEPRLPYDAKVGLGLRLGLRRLPLIDATPLGLRRGLAEPRRPYS